MTVLADITIAYQLDIWFETNFWLTKDMEMQFDLR